MKKINKPSREWTLLSSYADGHLSARKRRKAENLLKKNPSARQLLDKIYAIRKLIASLPEIKAPRNFTFQSVPTKQIQIPSLFSVMRFSAVTAATLLVVVLLIDFFPALNPLRMEAVSHPHRAELMAVEVVEDIGKNSPDIIFWGGGPAQVYQYASGKGEGSDAGIGGAGTVGVGGGAGIGGGDASGLGEPTTVELPMEEMSDEVYPNEDIASDEKLIPEEEIPEPAIIGRQLILGIRPIEERGRIQQDQALPDSRTKEQVPVSLLLIELVLGGLLITAFILMRIFRHGK